MMTLEGGLIQYLIFQMKNRGPERQQAGPKQAELAREARLLQQLRMQAVETGGPECHPDATVAKGPRRLLWDSIWLVSEDRHHPTEGGEL